MIADVNPFPSTLGRICPHPCESACNRAEGDEPLAVNQLERFLGDWALEHRLPLPSLETGPRDEWVGVVGAGPSGLSFAYQMARRGYRVTVYEGRERAGGMLRWGIPDYRLPTPVLDGEIERIEDLGVEIRLGTSIGDAVSLPELRERHPVLYIAIGAQKGLGLPVPGGDDPGVWAGTDYLDRVNHGESVELGRQVVVVGGGNTAMDAARTARRSGAEVTILYRRSRAEMPASVEEIEEALAEGVGLELLTAPVEVSRRDDGSLVVLARRMELGEPDASGRRRPVPIPGSDFEVPATTVIAAISQQPSLEGLEELRHEGAWLLAEDGEVTEGVWAGGDALGLGIAGDAIVQGRMAAEAVHARLRGRAPTPMPEEPPVVSDSVRLDYRPTGDRAQPAHLEPAIAVARADAEVVEGITEAQFLAEVERCMSCGSCFGCQQCWMFCTAGCFTRVEEPQPGVYFTLSLDQCEECGKCVELCPCGYLTLES
jgi:NADPH-dependent glutamate synthase beta subunit-like oxidoreductase/Pyruvate/2-oxoacid:ferredoxin oxidoreductase delta subunit